MPGARAARPEEVMIDFTTYSGYRTTRRIVPLTLEFRATAHQRKQWIVTAVDLENSRRPELEVALKDIHKWYEGKRSAC
jgi:hypothetical protein